VVIGAVADPRKWDRWPEAEAYLEPARALGDYENCIEPDEALWIVMDGKELLAACTARITEHGCEVMLVGGREYPRWLSQLDFTVGAAAKRAGAKRMTAMGRKGWRKPLLRLGWDTFGEVDGMTVYSREL
jgi:hypothetical protein